MLTVAGVRDAAQAWQDVLDASERDEYLETGVALEVGSALANGVREMLEDPTTVQALALARLMRDRPNEGALVTRHDPDAFMMAGYWTVRFLPSGFECGIAPNGDVSS